MHTLGKINFDSVVVIDFGERLKSVLTSFMFSDVPSDEVKFFTMGTGDGNIDYEGRLRRGGYWRTSSEWPLKTTQYKEFYLDRNGRLTSEILELDNQSSSKYTFDPKNPVPTIGGSLSAAAPWLCPGAFDQRGNPDRFIGSNNKLPLNSRDDVLTFQTEDLHIRYHTSAPVKKKQKYD